jgi:predicted transcriptional regulator
LALPSNATLLIVLVAANLVAVAALPDSIEAVLSSVGGITSHANPFHNHIFVPAVNVAFSAGLFGKFIAILYPVCYI